MTILDQRARHMRALSAWMEGRGPHPAGASGEAVLLPAILDQAGAWDTAPRGFQFSEYGNAAGMTA